MKHLRSMLADGVRHIKSCQVSRGSVQKDHRLCERRSYRDLFCSPALEKDSCANFVRMIRTFCFPLSWRKLQLVEVGVLCGGGHSICRGGCAVWRWA